MLSKEAVKAKNKYKKLGAMISWLVTEPWNPKMWKVKLQRFNFDNIVAILSLIHISEPTRPY